MVQERPVRVERRLSAILAADVAGYSRLMHNDEEATHAKLAALLTDAVAPAIAEHGGRVVKNTGDGFLAEFPSAVQAVRAAAQFQTRIKELTVGDAEDRRIALRVGVNIGDVIVEPHDIFGDGVNIAARLEGIAEPGGICISSSTFDQVRGKVGIEFADLGEQNLKNIDRPVRAYALVRDEFSLPTKGSSTTPSPPSVPHLSIVVLPFANISGDPEQEYFVDGVTESLTTDLSRISGALVIACNTAFTFKGKAIDVKKLGRELNVRYVLEGSMQRGGNRLRVNVQLIDAETGNHLWAERFDKPVADLFDMQDEIVSRLANTLDAHLIAAEARRVESSLHPDSLDLVFQGRGWFNKGLIPDYMARARGFFEKAVALDPENVEAMVGLARVDTMTGAALMTDDWSALLASAEATLTKALSLAPNHAVAHMLLASCKWSRSARPKPWFNASTQRLWITIWSPLMLPSGAQRFFLVAAQKLNPTSMRHSGFLLATFLPIDGWQSPASPRRSSVPMPKQSSGCAGPSTQTENIPPRISFSRLRWRGSGSWTKHGPPCKRDLRSIRVSPFAAFVMPPTHGATFRLSVPGATA
jgi:TolB-like protein/class 3 adenylate cyclase